MNVEQISIDLERILRLRTHPVGVRLCEKAEDLTKGNVPSAKISLCQMVKGAAHGGWTLACPKDQMGCFTAQMILGFREPGEKDVEHHRAQFAKDAEIARALMETKPKLGLGSIEGYWSDPWAILTPTS